MRQVLNAAVLVVLLLSLGVNAVITFGYQSMLRSANDRTERAIASFNEMKAVNDKNMNTIHSLLDVVHKYEGMYGAQQQ